MQKEFEAIIAADLPEVEKVAKAYQWIIADQIAHSRNEIELLKALGDQEKLVKEQIKLGMFEYTADIFAFCYQQATGRKLP